MGQNTQIFRIEQMFDKLEPAQNPNSARTGHGVLKPATVGTNEVQRLTVTGSPTGGDFKLTYTDENGIAYETAAIAYNANAAAIQSALRALTAIGATGVNVTGTGPFDVEFAGPLAAKNQRMLTLSNNGLTGGSTPSVGITEQTEGIDTVKLSYPKGQLVRQKTDGTNEWAKNGTSGYAGPLRIAKYPVVINNSGEWQYGSSWIEGQQISDDSVGLYMSGDFFIADLVGDVAALITSGHLKLIQGTSAAGVVRLL